MEAEMRFEGVTMPIHSSKQSSMPMLSMIGSGSSDTATRGKREISGSEKTRTVANMFNVQA